MLQSVMSISGKKQKEKLTVTVLLKFFVDVLYSSYVGFFFLKSRTTSLVLRPLCIQLKHLRKLSLNMTTYVYMYGLEIVKSLTHS